MILRWLERSQWEAKLRKLGAEPLEGLTPLNTAEWWRVEGQPPFVVSVEDDGRADFWAIQRLCEAISGKSGFNPPLDG